MIFSIFSLTFLGLWLGLCIIFLGGFLSESTKPILGRSGSGAGEQASKIIPRKECVAILPSGAFWGRNTTYPSKLFLLFVLKAQSTTYFNMISSLWLKGSGVKDWPKGVLTRATSGTHHVLWAPLEALQQILGVQPPEIFWG